jgi:hypothetical protein
MHLQRKRSQTTPKEKVERPLKPEQTSPHIARGEEQTDEFLNNVKKLLPADCIETGII